MEIICSESGFLGLDNIGVFNRSSVIPGAMQLEQADGTNWMGMYALSMMDIAVEIAMKDEAFEDTAPFHPRHFVLIAEALNMQGMWSAEDGFCYDTLSLAGSSPSPAFAGTLHCWAHLSLCCVHYRKENSGQTGRLQKKDLMVRELPAEERKVLAE